MFGDKKLQEENLKLKTENEQLKKENERLRFPTGRRVPADKQIDEKLAQPGAAQMEGVDDLLLAHIWEQSADAFDPDNAGGKRDYPAGAAAGLSQLRADLVERGVIKV